MVAGRRCRRQLPQFPQLVFEPPHKHTNTKTRHRAHTEQSMHHTYSLSTQHKAQGTSSNYPQEHQLNMTEPRSPLYLKKKKITHKFILLDNRVEAWKIEEIDAIQKFVC